MPPTTTVKTGFTLDRLYVSANLGDKSQYGVAGEAKWSQSGSGTAMLIVEKGSDKTAPWDFTFAVGVRNFNLSDVFVDLDLVKDISTQLVSTSNFAI